MSKLLLLALLTQALLATLAPTISIPSFIPSSNQQDCGQNLPSYIKTITFKADDGGFLRVNPTIGPNRGTAITVETVHFSYGGRPDVWEVFRIGDKIALKGPNGKFLSRCRHCWPGGVFEDSAFAHVNTPEGSFSQWKVTKRPNGKWVFQSDTGKYLARCYDCAKSSTFHNLVFVHENNPSNPWVQWDLA